MSIIVNENTRVVVRGINRDEGLFHTSQMPEYGTKIFGVDMLNFPLIPETFLSE